MADQTHLFSFGQITSVLTFQQIVIRIFYERKFGLFFKVTSREKNIYPHTSVKVHLLSKQSGRFFQIFVAFTE